MLDSIFLIELALWPTLVYCAWAAANLSIYKGTTLILQDALTFSYNFLYADAPPQLFDIDGDGTLEIIFTTADDSDTITRDSIPAALSSLRI